MCTYKWTRSSTRCKSKAKFGEIARKEIDHDFQTSRRRSVPCTWHLTRPTIRWFPWGEVKSSVLMCQKSWKLARVEQDQNVIAPNWCKSWTTKEPSKTISLPRQSTTSASHLWHLCTYTLRQSCNFVADLKTSETLNMVQYGLPNVSFDK